jgi:hypothetical protein
VVRLDPAGKILWDRTLDGPEVYSAAITGAPDGGFVVAWNSNNYDSGAVSKLDADGKLVWNRSIDSTCTDVSPAGDGGFVLAGSRTFRIDANGTTVWNRSDSSTSIRRAAAGGFITERSGMPYPYASVSRLDENGTVLWTQPVGNRDTGTIPSMYENTTGDIEVVYTYGNPAKDKDLVMYQESEQVTVGAGGNITGRHPLAAVAPLARTSDGGYVFLGFPFPDSPAFTTQPGSMDSRLHLVWLSPGGTVLHDLIPDYGKMPDPKFVLQARDGGYVTLVMVPTL